MRRRSFAVYVCGLAGCFLAGSLAAAHVQGIDRARLSAPPGVQVVEYRNANYSLLRRADGDYQIEVQAFPLRSAQVYRSASTTPSSAGPVHDLAAAVVAGAHLEAEVTELVLAWMVRNLRYDADRGAPQDAASVLERRSAHCTGWARTAVALLRAAGLEAREVAGWVADERGGQFHRWVEVHYADRGWVFSDPLSSHGFVPATYLRLAGEDIEGTGRAAPEGLLLERDDRLRWAGADPGTANARGVRRLLNTPAATAASLRVVAPGAEEVILHGRGVLWSVRPSNGEARFDGLAAGTYELEAQRGTGAPDRRQVSVGHRVQAEFHFPRRSSRTAAGAK